MTVANARPTRRRVLFLCTANAARSQMAEGLLRHLGGDGFEVMSAGTRPSAVAPEAVAVMRERGLDISAARSKALSEFDVSGFDYVLTLCDRANEECPSITAKVRRLHWALPDPAEVGDSADQNRDPLEPYRRVRDALEDILNEFVRAHL